MNSSTSELVSKSAFCCTSTGSEDSDESMWILTSGEARLRAPASMRAWRSLMAMSFSRRMPTVNSSSNFASSFRSCASSYVNAALDAMTLFVNRTERI